MTTIVNGTTGITFSDSSVQNTAAIGFRNRIINGAMVIDQRNNGASVTANDGYVTVDRWKFNSTQNGKGTLQRSTVAPPGFTNSLLFTSTSAYSVLSSDLIDIQCRIEGFNMADLGWGAVGAQAVTLSFWVRSSLTGTFGGSLRSGSGSARSYPFTYTISVANTWEQKTITVPGDTSGTWATDNTQWGSIQFGLGDGSTYSGTAGSWASAVYTNATGAVSVVGTNGATFYITGVQLEKATTASSFDFRSYGTELALCQRYYQRSNVAVASTASVASGLVYGSTTVVRVHYPLIVSMRTAPTMTYAGSIYYAVGAGAAVISNIASQWGGISTVMMDLTLPSASTLGQGTVIYQDGTAGSYFQATAEL